MRVLSTLGCFCFGLWLASAPIRARACGGTFCDRGPAGPTITIAPPRVDQSGENILFVEADGYIEAHVQIRYQGDPARFAWLVPMPEVPEVSVGSQPLFDALIESTAPVFGLRTTYVSCNGGSSTSESTGCGSSVKSASFESGDAGVSGDDSARKTDPIGKTVGTYDVTILQPQSADEVVSWLSENEFVLPDRSLELLGRYVESGSAFVAVRLTPGADTKEIHPLVFRYHGTRPSIPLQLTAVAATDDMKIRAFFLGAGRVFPSNYRHVELDQARLDWPNYAANYETAVARAVDETGDGLGFVTEYAGESRIAANSSTYDARWRSDPFLNTEPATAISQLQAQGQLVCGLGACAISHPVVLALLQHYLPAPTGMNEALFYGCSDCIEKADHSKWDAAAFARDYEERVVAPAQHARDLLAENAYLTRMVTFISPDEMTSDPVFHERSDMPDVSNQNWADVTVPCKGPDSVSLPGGRTVVTRSFFQSWPNDDATLPYAERIDSVPLSGKLQVIVDSGRKISARLESLKQAADKSAATNPKPGSCRVQGAAVQQSAWFFVAASVLLLRRRRARALARRS